LDREQGALLAAYRWFGTLRYGQSSATHYFSRRDQHYIEIADLFRELSPESAAVLERFPEFNSARLSQGIQFDNLDGRALLISAFHSARSPRSAQFSLLVQVAQELGSQENRAMLAAIEHLIQRELPYPARPVNPSATAGERLAVEFVVQAQSPEQERAVIAEIESQLRARGVAAAIETMGMALAFRSESVSRAGAAVTVANETMPWREFRFAGTPAADRAHLIIHEDGRAQIMEPRTHRIEGSTYVRWHTVFDFFLLNPNEGAVEALTSRRIVVRYPGHEVQLIRGPGGWRAELNDTCHRLMLGQDGAA
jgi:hypothetical protein